MRIILLCMLLILYSCTDKNATERTRLALDGWWLFSTDPSDSGIADKWYLMDFSDSIPLPGTMDLSRKGYLNTDTTTMHLNRIYRYDGAAWYRKKISIPESFRGQHIELIFERTKPSMIWIDSLEAGQSLLLESPQSFDLSDLLTPGDHYLTVRIDNRLRNTPYGNVHIYSDDTQTNWNGILGRMELEVSPQTRISDLQVYPDMQGQKIRIRMNIDQAPRDTETTIGLFLDRSADGKTKHYPPVYKTVRFNSFIELEYDMKGKVLYWDEFRQPLYTLRVELAVAGGTDVKSAPFGMREFTTKGTHFTINGRNTFLRGKHDACVFPLTGHPPMDTEGWQQVFRIAKSYGINHYRFHSWCPPEAAFDAADREGIYLQPELPFWGGLDSDSVAGMLLQEGFGILKSYANHPSFVLFSHGNEIWSGHDRVEKNILALKEYDSRPMYTMGSNNNSGYVPPRPCSDFFIAARTPYSHDTILTHTRLAQAYVDSRDGGILNTVVPATDYNFSFAVSSLPIPLVGHETGQYQIFPDFRETEKYTGVLRAWNLEVFRKRLEQAGMADQDSLFNKASGAWSALCYRAEMETALRTPGMAGFQLLDLQDFPGQGTALVGILDAFMDSKNVVTQEDWLKSCNDIVLLAEFPKYCWTLEENYRAKVLIANYSDRDMEKARIDWKAILPGGKIYREGHTDFFSSGQGELSESIEISFGLSDLGTVSRLDLEISLPGTEIKNSYPLWVYPADPKPADTSGIIVARQLDPRILSMLNSGASVLLFPHPEDLKGEYTDGLFPPDFWNYGMFRGISESNGKPVSPGTLGLLMDPSHPVFINFPTDFHTNWQWYTIVKESHPLILDRTVRAFRPIIQVIDNLERNHKLGLLFEFRYGKGKLLVCMADPEQLPDRPEAQQFYRALLGYMKSDTFRPDYELHQGETVLW
ncbi:MAG: sugar-binding domain-containing protein [Bacteroidota bacterium]